MIKILKKIEKKKNKNEQESTKYFNTKFSLEKKVHILSFFLSENAEIKPKLNNFYKQKFHRKISRAIKHAQSLKLLPYLNLF